MSILSPLPIVLPNAAALDIGKEEIVAAVPPDRDPQPVRRFATFTLDLHALADWLAACGIDSIALESTGIYRIPVFEILEERGFQVCVVNAAPRGHPLRRVPGRKTDIQDCQWLQQLHSLGLLTGSFRPDAEICALRTLLRHRSQLIQHRAPHILHMQKALHAMNLPLDCVLSDITGQTGLLILRAIVAGECDPVKLAQLRHPNCHSSSETIARALTGHYQPEPLFTLQQSLEFYDFYTGQIARCDAEIERQFSAIKPRFELAEGEEPPTLPVRRVKTDSHRKNPPAAQTRRQIVRITGVDLVAVEGISASIAQTILSEIGTDMSRWPTVKHFCAWLRLAPKHDLSGGRVLRSRTLPTSNRAAQAFRMAAQSVIRSDSALGAFYRRMKARIGPQQALVATAHKIARIVYVMLRDRRQYPDVGAATYEQQFKERELKHLQRKAARLGFTLEPKPA